MKKQTLVLLTAVIALTGTALAQGGRMGGNPGLNAVITKLFGENKQFSADVEIDASANGKSMIIPGKMYFDAGKTRFEINLADAKGDQRLFFHK